MAQKNLSISNFSSFFKKIIFPFILILIIGGLVFNYFFEKTIVMGSPNSSAYKINRILNENYPDEIPIFGSSRAESGFFPDSLGTNYFNYGLSGIKFDVCLFFLQEECKKKKNNPVIITEIGYEGLLSGFGNVSNFIPFAQNKDIKEILGSSYSFFYNIPFIKYYGYYEYYIKDYINEKTQLTKITNKGASLEKNEHTAKQFNEIVEQRKSFTFNFYIDTSIKNRLITIISNNSNRYFIFVVTPLHYSCFASFTATDKVNNFFEQLSAYKNVKILDFSRFQMTDDKFLNTSHLNYKGAILFNKTLKDSLQTVYKNYKTSI